MSALVSPVLTKQTAHKLCNSGTLFLTRRKISSHTSCIFHVSFELNSLMAKMHIFHINLFFSLYFCALSLKLSLGV